MGRAVAEVLDALLSKDIDTAVTRPPRRVAASEPGAPPHTLRGPGGGRHRHQRQDDDLADDRPPARTDGKLVGWSNTDGIYVDGELVEAGDYSGPSGAGRVLAHKGVELAVTETARGGILLKGIGLTRNDVSVVTNVSADHLGQQGIDTVDQLAEVKAVVPRITRKDGWADPQRRRPPGLRDAGCDQGPAVGVLTRPRLAGHP